MTYEKRVYRKSKRAELEELTRLRITESAVELHGTLGPSRTSVRALAEHAGVRRSTVYRHFADEAAILSACTAHWLAANPFPDPASWSRINDADARLSRGLQELYAHYRRTQRMMDNVLRDEMTMPVVKRMLGGYRQYLSHAQAALVKGRPGPALVRRRVYASIGHALAFYTWRSLAIEQGLDDTEGAQMMCLLIITAGQSNV